MTCDLAHDNEPTDPDATHQAENEDGVLFVCATHAAELAADWTVTPL